MKKKEPGLIDVPGKNDLRPHAKNVKPAGSIAPNREYLKFAQSHQMVQDFGAPEGGWHGAQSPSSAQHTPGLPTSQKAENADTTEGTLQPTIKREP